MEQSRGRAALQAWLTDNNHNQTTFANLVKIPQQVVSGLLRGHYISLERAVAIERVTGISAASWLEPSVVPRRRVAKAS